MTMTNGEFIKFKDVSKKFEIPREKQSTFKEHLFNFANESRYEKLWALRGANFSVKKGEFISFIGSNGSGKTTLLRLISKVYLPTCGEIFVGGTIAPFLELNVGFQGDLNVKDNIYLYGATMGLTRKRIGELFGDIVGFAELEKYIGQKVKNLSTGMEVRLAFSIAAHADADILLVDEVLAVGDKDFQEKCFALFKKFKSAGKTIIFVSHDLDIVKQFSDRVGWLAAGVIKKIGAADEVVESYASTNARIN